MNCPFCGVQTDAPHESQEACICALTVEVERMRTLVQQLKPPAAPSTPARAEDRLPPPDRSS
jgi:hypothetical protein